MKLFHTLLLALQFLINPINAVYSKDVLDTPNGCVTFSVGSGTGCAWMCNYCSTKLGTNNFYFTDGICSYVPGGCVGSPQLGVDYTCCSVGVNSNLDLIQVFLDNENNSPTNNPPGFNQWVGGQYRGDPSGIKVDKTDTKLLYTIDSNVDQLLTWYYNWGWYSGQALTGPWKNGTVITIPPVASIDDSKNEL
jgi:hypothetical protein